MSKRRSAINNSSTSNDLVLVSESPVSSIKQRGNLTGNVRIIRDHVADMCNFIQEWNTELIVGMTVISEIKTLTNKKIKMKKNDENIYVDDLQNFSKELEKICEKMEVIVEKLKHKCTSMLSTYRLYELHDQQKPLFLTWPTSKFVETSRNVYEMFKTELKMKLLIKDEICFCTDKNTSIFLSSAWFHQPYIEKSVNLSFEAMLKEVGHTSAGLI